MTRLRVALTAFLLLPSLALAQRGGGGGGGGSSRGTGKAADWNAVGAKGGPAGPTISPKDFQEKSIFQLYLDKKKDLKLSDAQVVAFKDADAKLSVTFVRATMTRRPVIPDSVTGGTRSWSTRQ